MVEGEAERLGEEQLLGRGGLPGGAPGDAAAVQPMTAEELQRQQVEEQSERDQRGQRGDPGGGEVNGPIPHQAGLRAHEEASAQLGLGGVASLVRRHLAASDLQMDTLEEVVDLAGHQLHLKNSRITVICGYLRPEEPRSAENLMRLRRLAGL